MWVSNQSFMGLFRAWATTNELHGGKAFERFVMLNFLEAIDNLSNDFVFKGGNLLWHYIKTPRQTHDLDFSTLTIKSHHEVKTIIEKALNAMEDIVFSIKSFKVINQENAVGSHVVINYSTSGGQTNQFPIDIVYALPTDIKKVKSTISKREYQSASIENIICDKISASHEFGSGNTRVKDFDDLFRIKNSQIDVDSKKLMQLISQRKIDLVLDKKWITKDMQKGWKNHLVKNKGLPLELEGLFDEINSWLKILKE